MQDMVCIRQRTKKLRPRHELTKTNGQTDRVHDTSSHDDASMCQLQDAYGKEQRSYDPDTNSCKTDIFDIEVKGQSHQYT